MSAGDAKIIGWQGSPAYREITAPTVESEPLTGGQSKRTLRRTLLCRRVDVLAVIQGLTHERATLSISVPTGSGTSTTVSYGAGWTLKTYSEVPHGKYFSEINLAYEKTAITAFEIGLPSGITMTGSGGIGQIKYGTNILFTFNSGASDTGEGWDAVEFIAFTNDYHTSVLKTQETKTSGGGLGTVSREYAVTNTEQAIKGVYLKYNGAVVHRLTPSLADYSALGLTFQNTWTSGHSTGGPDAQPFEAFVQHSEEVINYEALKKYIYWETTGTTVNLMFWNLPVLQFDVGGLS